MYITKTPIPIHRFNLCFINTDICSPLTNDIKYQANIKYETLRTT